jgi:hypothetical protein
MDSNIDNLKSLLAGIRTISFFGRLFRWKKIKEKLIDAFVDIQKLIANADSFNDKTLELKSANSDLAKDNEISKSTQISQSVELSSLRIALLEQSDKISNLNSMVSSKSTTVENQKDRINQLENAVSNLTQRNDQLAAENKDLSGEDAALKESLSQIISRKNQLELELEGIKKDHEYLKLQRDILKEENTQFYTNEETRKQKYENDVFALNSIRQQIQNERREEIEEKNKKEIERINKLKETWGNHEVNVKNLIRNICGKHIIEYVEKVPFSGEPDNTLKICEEFVIFDAKSPAGEDLTNFPSYIRDQAEKAKKYAKQESVKLDIFFVVPTNTLERLSQFMFNLSDYNVCVISVDSLEQIILGLKKIEEYEFAEQLSPEERDNICRVLGKFAHLTKRRIQIDSFFAKQFIELAYKTETSLPKEILEKVIEFERSEKLNPPIEKRAKAISTKELEKDAIKINSEAASKGILVDDTKISIGLNDLQLYTEEQKEK